MNPSKKDVWKMFDIISPTYDKINRVLSLGMDQRWRKKLAKELPPKKNLKIIDLATGTGDQAAALLKSRASIHSITGIDLSLDMMEIGKKKGLEKMEFCKGDAENPPFPDATFDVATFSFGIRNVNSPLKSLQSIHHILKPKGRCLILEFSLPPKPIRGVYLFYLRYILPQLGGLLSGKKEAYKYLNETIEEFPSGKDFCFLLKEAGFHKIRAIPMALGAVTLYIGDKS